MRNPQFIGQVTTRALCLACKTGKVPALQAYVRWDGAQSRQGAEVSDLNVALMPRRTREPWHTACEREEPKDKPVPEWAQNLIYPPCLLVSQVKKLTQKLVRR